MKYIKRIKSGAITLSLALMLASLGFSNPVKAATLNLNDSPLFLLNSVDPNIMLTFDDSGSMRRGYLPDGISGNDSNKRGCSTTFNKIYFNPSLTYSAGVDENGAPMADASFTAALNDGYNSGSGTTDLSTSFQVTWSGSNVSCGFADNSGRAAFYYSYDSTNTTGGAACNTAAGVDNDDCYDLVQPIPAAQQQNFANWYTYYRIRTLLSKTAAGRAFAGLGSNIRLGFQRLNTCNAAFGSAPSVACPGTIVKPFTGTYRTDFFDWLYSSPTNDMTPLRTAMNRAGQYLSTSNANSPWAEDPGTSVGTEYSCRQNFHIAFTDGLWNGGSPSVGNTDNTTTTFPTADKPAAPDDYPFISTYTPGNTDQKIYQGTASDTLADVAFKYWSEDARSDLTNDVTKNIFSDTGDQQVDFFNPVNDPAFWQHLVNFTVGLGVDGELDFDGDYQDLLDGTKTWPTTGNFEIDDLWHAAVNSRGKYFNASNPEELVNAFSDALNNISSRIGSATALAVNTGSLGTSTTIYQARFNSRNWGGQLLAFSLDPTDGTVSTSPVWDAAEQLDDQNYDTGREIITYNLANSDGTAFRWASLPAAGSQQTDLNTDAGGTADANGEARLNYLRGDTTNEGAALNFRDRTRPCGSGCTANTGSLGDIVDSAPRFVGKPPFFYTDSLESGTNAAYSTFFADNKDRTPMIYVGANDGMLHAFDAATGDEKLAYVPSFVYPNLSQLTSVTYNHKQFVNGSPTSGDVYIDYLGNATPDWRSIIVGGMRKGGRGIYALDVTDPTTFNESNADDLVLWEFTDPDLGYTYSQPSIIRMANGKWAAIFGNGYNNVSPGTGEGFLFVVFIDGGIDGTWTLGTDYIKIGTGVGDTTTPNGLAAPSAVDTNRDSIADYIYVGDQQGNMWKFDVSDATPSNWTTSGNRSLIFAAIDDNDVAQPITTAPRIGTHPEFLGGYMVYFGTGKYLEASDNSVTGPPPPQSFYAIWDNGSTVVRDTNAAQNELLEQTFTEVTIGSNQFRIVSDNPMTWDVGGGGGPGTYKGWYIDLPSTGEKQISNAVLRSDRIIFTTLVPAPEPCGAQVTGWLIELDLVNGGVLDATFDTNDDGVIDEDDWILTDPSDPDSPKVPPSGIPYDGGASPTVIPGPPGPGGCIENKLTSTADGKINRVREDCTPSSARESWRQLK